MKIAVSICKSKGHLNTSEFFRKCSHFFVFDSESGKEQILINPFLSELDLDGIQAAGFLINYGIDVLITKGIKSNPLRFLNSANIKTYLYKGRTAKEALKLFNQNKLSELKLLDTEYYLS